MLSDRQWRVALKLMSLLIHAEDDPPPYKLMLLSWERQKGCRAYRRLKRWLHRKTEQFG